MKKLFAVLIVTLSLSAGLSAQTQWPDINRYADIIMGQFVAAGRDWKRAELGDTDPVLNAKYAGLESNTAYLDTPLEVALYIWYSGATNPVPAEAEAILPHSNPGLVDRQLGALVYKEIVVYRFLNDSAAAGRYEAILQVITSRGNATRAEIESYFRQGIGQLVAGEVDREFNRVSFLLENYSTSSKFSYDVVLTRNPRTGQYAIHYDRASVQNDDKELSSNSLEALLVAMRNSGDFVPAAIDTVRSQAALIPAVSQAGKTGRADLSALLTYGLTAFYTANTNEERVAAVRIIEAIYVTRLYPMEYNGSQEKAKAGAVEDAIYATLRAFNPELLNRVDREIRSLISAIQANRPALENILNQAERNLTGAQR